MEFLNNATAEEVDGKAVMVVVKSSTAEVLGTKCVAFLRGGAMFIDCIPKLNRKYIVPVPDDAVISCASTNDAPAGFVIVIEADSEAGRFLQTLADARSSG